MVSRHNIDRLDDLATYLREGIGNRQRAIREIQLRQDESPERADPTLDDVREAAELQGEVNAFAKVLQILHDQFEIR